MSEDLKDIYFPVAERDVPGYTNSANWKAIYRINDDNSETLLNIATSQYNLIKNVDIYKPVLQFCTGYKGGTIRRSYTENNGARCWVDVTFPQLKHEITLKDNTIMELKPALIIKNSYDCSTKFSMNLGAEYTKNGKRQLRYTGVKLKGAYIKHQGTEAGDKVKEASDSIIAMIDQFNETVVPFYEKLINYDISSKDRAALIESICIDKLNFAKRKFESITTAMNETNCKTLFDIFDMIADNIHESNTTTSRDSIMERVFKEFDEMC